MGKWGVYGVSIFYILSGLTLYHVYFNSMIPNFNDLKGFFLKRFFRIYPLLWLTIILTLILNSRTPSIIGLGINLTGLFGIVKWDGYIGTGVWSIGNELVFYLFFPVFVFLTKKNKLLFYILSGILTLTFLYFAFFKLDIHQSSANHKQWSMYVNPLNQVFLFLSGYLMGLHLTKYRLSKFEPILIFTLALATFIIYPTVGENLTAGVNRIVLTALSFLICLAFYKTTLRFPSFINKIFTALGEASYSIYLLHPIVWLSLKIISQFFLSELAMPLQISFTVIITIIIGYFNHKYFEIFFIALGKKISKKLNVRNSGNINPREINSEEATKIHII